MDMILGASGGIFGIVGALFKHGIEVYQEKKKAEASLALLAEQNKHELLMADKHQALIEVEAKNALTLADLNASRDIDIAAYGSLTSSFEQDKATYSDAKENPYIIAVDVVRGMIRPLLTVIFSLSLIGFTAWLWIAVPDMMAGNEEFMKQTFYRLIDSLIFLGTSSCGWWFGSRGVSK